MQGIVEAMKHFCVDDGPTAHSFILSKKDSCFLSGRAVWIDKYTMIFQGVTIGWLLLLLLTLPQPPTTATNKAVLINFIIIIIINLIVTTTQKFSDLSSHNVLLNSTWQLNRLLNTYCWKMSPKAALEIKTSLGTHGSYANGLSQLHDAMMFDLWSKQNRRERQ